jgi:hypothetical protein
MQNIQADGEHSFYGAHCDYLVAVDKNLRIKSKVLYNEFNISTKIIEPKELISETKKVLDPINNKVNFLETVFSFCKKENLIESFPASEENKIEAYAFKLPIYYFNYFNYLNKKDLP